jgi:hypothetical protein
MKCEHCGSGRIIDARIQPWHMPAVKCQHCGWHKELPFEWQKSTVPARLAELDRAMFRYCSTPKCGERIDERNLSGKCRSCRGIEQAEAALQKKLARRVERRERREASRQCQLSRR